MLIVDGHNLIGRTPGLSLEREEEAREQVLRRLAATQGRGRSVVVVFDGDRPGAAKEGRFGGVRVVFSPRGRAADEEILRRTQEVGPAAVTVVTSDRQLAARAAGLGARVESCEEFRERLDRGARRARAAPEAEPPVPQGEVEEWLRVFQGKHKI